MKIAFIAGHIGSSGLKPSGQYGGGELHTFAFLDILRKKYDVTAIVPNLFYPAFDSAAEYGYDLEGLEWRPMGKNLDWLRTFDVMIAKDHGRLYPPICHRNILSVFFPQYPDWGESIGGYDTVLANSQYTASWVKRYWKRDADVVYPPVPIDNILSVAGSPSPKKFNRIVNIGRFFRVAAGNNKNHLVVINAFKKMMLPDWELVLIGAKQDGVYFQEVLDTIGDDKRIKIYHDLPRQEYIDMLAQSRFIWAATGYSGGEDIPPSSREHFGIFPVEGAVLGTIPFVHNSGGSPEGPTLVWDTPDDLIEKTRELIEDQEKAKRTANDLKQRARQFDIEVQAARLIEIIERPVVVLPEEGKGKVFISAPARENITVGMVSDSAERTTGFGMVTKGVGTRLSEMGYKVKLLGLSDPHRGPPNYTDLLYTWRAWPGENYHNLVKSFVQEEKVDVLYVNYDPGNIRLVLDALMGSSIDIPVVSYMPIEAAPVIPQMIDTLRLVRLFNGETILYTRWAVEQVLKAGGPRCAFVYHGADHADFRPPTPEEAIKVRRAVGWEDKFVIVSVGRNKRSKNHQILLDAIKILVDAGHNDIRAYIHSNPHDFVPNSSVPLYDTVEVRGLQGIVEFPADLHDQTRGVQYDGDRFIQAPDTNDENELRRIMISALNYMERLWLAFPNGAYVNTSMAEGFGLPQIEAMRVGLPVISIDDQGPQREVMGNVPIWVPHSWEEYWNTGAILRNANPAHIAQAIIDLKEGNRGLDRWELSTMGIEWAHRYTWDETARVIDEAILRRVSL